jgi:2-keto-3-deoxy-L-rhamnonate aldolase RhmA
MITVRNHAKERLEAGELALGVGLRQARTVDIARIMKTAGYDFLFIDMEHNSVSMLGVLRLSCRLVATLLQVHPNSDRSAAASLSWSLSRSSKWP